MEYLPSYRMFHSLRVNNEEVAGLRTRELELENFKAWEFCIDALELAVKSFAHHFVFSSFVRLFTYVTSDTFFFF